MSRRIPTPLRVIGVALATALLAAGCSSGSSGSSGPGPGVGGASATAAPSPSATLPTPVTGVPDFQPSAKAFGNDAAAPTSNDAGADTGNGSGGALGAPGAVDQPYWATDGKHYVVVNGAWAYDYYEAPTNDSGGQPIPGEIGIYRATDNVEAYVMDTNLAGYTAFRDLSNPLFNTVRWAAWPTGQTATDANLIYQVALDGNAGSLVWFTQAQLDTIVNAGLGYRIGFGGQPATQTSLWEQWTSTATNTNGVLFGQDLNHTWVQPNCSSGCTTY